tara:strand:- start:3408 stop:5753 length:2346 start_codon:yes stop_codon:yes gene_type:complete
MATVPIQTTPSVELETGQAPLFSATNIEPVRDTGTVQGISNLSKAQKQLSEIAVKLQDEQDDLQAGEAANSYQKEADEKVNSYLSLTGSATVATVDTDITTNKPITQTDKLSLDLDEIAEKYRSGLNTKSARDIFNSKFSAYKRIDMNRAVKHSLKEKQKAILAENQAEIDIAKMGAKNNYLTFNQPDGDYEKYFETGKLLIKKQAELNNQNTDLSKGPLSSIYVKNLMEYELDIAKDVVKNLTKIEEFELAKLYEDSFNPDKKIPTGNTEYINLKQGEYTLESCVNGVLNNNSNQNTGNYLDISNKIMCLKSSHMVDDGMGSSVKNGLHTKYINVAGSTKSDNINTLEKIRNESKFYKLDSNATIIKEHMPTHTFAIMHLGVKKADSLYTKSKSGTDDNKKIIENYNKLINEEISKIYQGDFVETVANDLEIIERGIKYDNDFSDNLDFITGLRPKEELKQELEDTITDSKQLAFALKDLDVKYNKLKDERTAVYNQSFNNAKEIAFEEDGGWKNLADNNIDIEMYTPKDQEILKKGQPKTSDKDTVIYLKENPIEIRNNLDSYSQMIDRTTYASLKNYRQSLQGKDKVIAATIDNKLLNLVLKEKGFDDIRNKTNDDAKDDYLEIEVEWANRIDEKQKNTNKEIDRTAKREILEEILNNKVIFDQGFFASDFEKPLFTVDDDQMENIYVKVKGESIWLKTINDYQRTKIMKTLDKHNLPITSQRIAEYWVKAGKPTANNDIDDMNFHKKNKKVNKKINTETSSSNNNSASYMPYFYLPF